PVPGIDVAARAALLAGIGGVHDCGRNTVLLLEVLQFLPDHRPPTVLEQPVHSTRESRRPEVQALEDQVGRAVPFDDPVQDPVHFTADEAAKLLDVSPIPLRGARPPSHALQVGGTRGDPQRSPRTRNSTLSTWRSPGDSAPPPLIRKILESKGSRTLLGLLARKA